MVERKMYAALLFCCVYSGGFQENIVNDLNEFTENAKHMSGLVCFDMLVRSLSLENTKDLRAAYKGLGFTATKDSTIRVVREKVCTRIHGFILKMLPHPSYDN